MITNADVGRVIFLSVGLKDGAIEAFDDIKDAVSHATDRVTEDATSERAIFVAVPRARVRMAVRVDPIEAPAALPVPESADPGPAQAWEKSQELAQRPNGLNAAE